MSNQPLNSSDQSKILIFGLLMLPSIGFLVGVIPTLFLAFGIFMMKKNEDFSHVTTATRNFRGYVSLILVGCIISAAYCATTLNAEDRWDRLGEELIISLVFAGICIAYLVFVKHLFINPLSNHSEWIEVNGIFATKPKNPSNTVALGEVDIIKGEKLKQYSVADELIKWAKLKEDGHISEEEFNEARRKLLKRA
ncbi:SHOCT domain-containing protein [Thauera terpenica]|uniref:SHOCT domain-containing protein n=1 Tax=Thauera terpenica TaxID=76113 RepID=UPI000A023E6F|nr:SHOCT domain-containing protein [Thauera terpenica]